MKKLLLSIAIITASLSVSAQTVGLVVQPEFKTSNIRKGFFAETPIYKSIGIYSDYKLMNTKGKIADSMFSQWNAGLSFRVLSNVKVFGTRSIVNNEKVTMNVRPVPEVTFTNKLDAVYQAGLIYSVDIFTVLGAYETGGQGHRVTVGFGFNL
jgi:hypothetical protein